MMKQPQPILPDPIFNHARYCTLSKVKRAAIVTELSFVAAGFLKEIKAQTIVSLISWELIILSLKSTEKQNFLYTALLDAGVSFTDGSDGILWGSSKGLKYHNVPASEILQLRQGRKYAKTQLDQFDSVHHIYTKTPEERRAVTDELRHQLRRIRNRIETQTPKKTKSRNCRR